MKKVTDLIVIALLWAAISLTPCLAEADKNKTASDTDWVNWVIVNCNPARTFTEKWDNDQARIKFYEDFDPDVLDMWSGQRMNRADFFRMRGVAVSGRLGNEWQESINDTAGHTLRMFLENGIGMTESGVPAKHPPTKYNGEYGMNVLTGRWRHMVEQHLYRQSDYADLLFQDNIALGTISHDMGFSDCCNELFVNYMRDKFSRRQLAAWGMTKPDKFNIRKYLYEKRKELGISLYAHKKRRVDVTPLLLDPILQEYIRFQFIAHTNALADLKSGIDRSAKRYGRDDVALVGNQAGAQGYRILASLHSQTVDAVWIEASTPQQPCYGQPRNAISTMSYKVSESTGNFKKPVWLMQYAAAAFGEGKRLPLQLSAAEAYANGGVPILAYSVPIWRDANFNSKDWKTYAQVAQFAGKNRGLFIDRQRVADVGLVYSITSTFWRQFSSLGTDLEHTDNLYASARLLEDYKIPYEVITFGHPDVFDDQVALDRLDRYKTVVLPEVDCISNRQVKALIDFVQRGGKLVLWGDKTGTRDEELNLRSRNAFDLLQRSTGRGKVVKISDQQVSNYRNPGDFIVNTGENQAVNWKYTTSKPADSWRELNFNDNAWETGSMPFGTSKIWKNVRTDLEEMDVWLRKTVVLDEVPVEPTIRFSQIGVKRLWYGPLTPPGQGFKVYINGVLAGIKGFTYSPYYDISMNSQAAAAFKKGKNIIAVHSKIVSLDRKFFDIGFQDYSDDSKLAAIVKPDKTVVETDATRLVWTNVYEHGSGPMWSIQLINYDINLETDSYLPCPVKLKVRHPQPEKIKEVRCYQFDGEVAKLPFKTTADGAITITAPELKLWAAVVLADYDEIEARFAAAQARKWQQRLRIAMRCEGQDTDENQQMFEQAEAFLRRSQSNANIRNFSILKTQSLNWAEKLENQVKNITQNVQRQQQGFKDQLMSVQAVKKLDFGTDETEPGWQAVTPETKYDSNKGFGWTKITKNNLISENHKKPDLVLGDFVRPQSAAEIIPPYSVAINGTYPLTYPQEHPAEFRVDLPNGKYVITLVTGLYKPGAMLADEKTVSMTFVDLYGRTISVGEPLRNGKWQQRSFPVDVKNGHILLGFRGPNIGPYFHNSVEWMINGLVIQQQNQTLTAESKASLKLWQQMNQTQINDWSIIGPFSDSHWNGLSKEFEPERNAGPDHIFTIDYDGSEAFSPWRNFKCDKNAPAIVPLYKLLDGGSLGRGFVSRGAAAYGMTQLYSTSDTEVVIAGSISGTGAVFLNGQEIIRDEIVMGLVPQEFSKQVQLKAGWNKLLVKSLHCWMGEWSYHIEVMTPDGKPVNGLKVSPAEK